MFDQEAHGCTENNDGKPDGERNPIWLSGFCEWGDARAQALQIGAEFGCARIAIRWILLQRLHNHALETGRNHEINCAGPRRLAIEDGVDQQRAIGLREGTFAG